jgi:N-acetylmuramoyl-L-alanine amidase
LLLLLGLLVGSVATGYAAPTESQGHYHVVRYGETLSGIAYRYGVSVHALLQANPRIYNPHLIYAGMTLYIPQAYTPPAFPPAPPTSYCRFNHYISYGQNLSSIAAYYGVHPYAIAQANHLYNLNRIYAGQYLCIP